MNSKTPMVALLAVCLAILLPAGAMAKTPDNPAFPNTFIRNVGQIRNEHAAPGYNIDFRISGSGVNVYVSNRGLYYQWHKANGNVSITAEKNINETAPAVIADAYVMQVELVGANMDCIAMPQDQQPYYEHYYLPHCYDKIAHSYNKIVYKNIYPNIDWVLYTGANNVHGFKHEFIVHAGGNAFDIKLLYNGATSLTLKDATIHAETPLGKIIEEPPYTYDINTKAEVESRYVLTGNTLSFRTARQDNIVIDPSLNWGAYFKNPNKVTGTCTAADTFGNSYICGYTNHLTYPNVGAHPGLASTGAYQEFRNGGIYDGFIAQYNASGNYVNWATYFGGEGGDQVLAATTDRAGNIYAGGVTFSSYNIGYGTPQQVMNGATNWAANYNIQDGFLVKFNRFGGIEWATYVGGPMADQVNAVACDAFGAVYAGGWSESDDSIATSGVHQTKGGVDTGFIIKYSTTTGKRIWGTYYNGYVNAIATGNNNSVYIGGDTKLYTGVGTAGTHQPSFGSGLYNGFVARLNATNGKREWGSYYGGTTIVQSLTCDSLYNVYLGGGGVLAKLDSAGKLVWGKTFPGTTSSMTLSPDNKVWIGGYTTSSSGIGTPNGYITSRVTNPPIKSNLPSPAPPIYDAYLAKFDNDGKQLYGTYYGGADREDYASIAYGVGKVFLVGTTFSYSHISTPGANQSNKDDTNDHTGYIAQFQADTNVYIKFPYIDTQLCIGGPLNLKYGVTNLFRPGNTFTVQLSNTSGSFALPVNIGNVTYNDRGEIACTIPLSTTPGTGYRIRIVASAPADTFYCYDRTIRISEYYYPKPFAPQPICKNFNLTLIDSSHVPAPLGVKYTWISPNPGRLKGQFTTYLITGLVLADSGYYTLIADNYGCVRKDSVHVFVTTSPSEPIVSGDTSLCIGDTLMLTASSPVAGVTFGWFDPANNFLFYAPSIQIPGVAIADAGKYRVAAILNGCQSDAQYGQVITVHPLPQPTATNTGPVCAGEELKLNATDTITNVTYTWSSSNGSFSHNKKDTTIKNTSTALSSQYTVKTRTIHGCENTAVTNVTVKPLPNDPDTRSNSPVCTRTALQLLSTATNAATYSWTGPNGFTSAQQSPVLPNSTPGMQGRYILVVDLDGCKKADTIEVQIDQSPDTPQLSSNSPLQTGKTLELKIGNKQSGVNYTWSGPNFSSNEAEPKLPNVIPVNSGVYTATAISGKCIVQDTIHIVVKDETGKDPKEPVVIFPNPNNGSFRITGETQTAGDVELAVFASDGKRVYKATITPQNNKIEADVNIGGISAGVYRLKIRIDGKATGLSFTIKP